ncbi:hypothetical protein J7K97_00930 [Candidatus Aerophobetes bacterium]|nr:hypothetical protein [Candidatus Aerophobetes bacterium]
MANYILRPNEVVYSDGEIFQYPDSGNYWDKIDDTAPDDDSTYLYTEDLRGSDYYPDYNYYTNFRFKVPPIDPEEDEYPISVKFYARCRGDSGTDIEVTLEPRIWSLSGQHRKSYSLTDTWTTYESTTITQNDDGTALTWEQINNSNTEYMVQFTTTKNWWETPRKGYATQCYVEVLSYKLKKLTTDTIIELKQYILLPSVGGVIFSRIILPELLEQEDESTGQILFDIPIGLYSIWRNK